MFLNKVRCNHFLPYEQAIGSAAPLVNRTTGTPTAPAVVDNAWKLATASTSEVEVNGLVSQASWRLEDIRRAAFLMSLTLASTHAKAVFGLTVTADDDSDNMLGILFVVDVDGTVSIQVQADELNYGSPTLIDTGVTLDDTMREFVLDFADGVVLADPRLGGSYGGRRAVQVSITDDQGKLRPICRANVFDLGGLDSRVKLIAQVSKTAHTDVSYLNLHAAEVEYRLVVGS
jgi:hypothetical protein